jgi:mono/diheme cytochrome c family protein
MTMRFAAGGLAILVFIAGSACAQDATVADDVQQGHHLALVICVYCHVAASDQESEPILKPPAPPFAAIAQRPEVNAEFLRAFLATTHRSLEAKKGMPNPELLDFQIRQVSAYLLSLRKKP